MPREHRFDPYIESGIENTPFEGICRQCSDYGVWLTPRGIVAECPKLQLGHNDHKPLSEGAKMILRAGRHLARRARVANPISFAVARTLSRFDTASPCKRDELAASKHFAYANSTVKREIALTIEDLRSNWLLPVASRKSIPHGYWIATDEADFREWVERATSAPIRQLTTIHAVARANFPVFAEQLELVFWTDMPVQYSPETVAVEDVR